MIGSIVAVLSDGTLKERSPSAFRPSIESRSSPLRSADRMRSCRQTDGQQRAGADGMEHIEEFLADHHLTHRRRESNQHSADSDFSPAAAFYHSKRYLQLIRRYPRS